MPECWRPALAVLALLLALASAGAQPAGAQSAANETAGAARAMPSGAEGAAAQLDFIDGLYRQGESFRAESEILRFLFEYPDHPRRPEVELLRARLYLRDGHAERAGLMLYALLDRQRSGAVRAPAARLLVFALVRQGRLDDAVPWLAAAEFAPAALEPLRQAPPALVPPRTAVTWSTWLPGSGFFVIGEPGKGSAAVGLNLGFTAGALLALQQGNPPAALVFALVEIALYRGGREAVGEAAQAKVTAARLEAAKAWLEAHGEPAMLRAGLSVPGDGN
ncbi:MAG: hypothetical protein HY342_09745 [Candidatus Lambdaproteobacteria bacterium]|nr:hypothetical protein [Candidatus Lambdaproteobacteria bacterium]